MKYEVNPEISLLPDTISFDTEYTELNIRKADLLSVSIGVSPDLTWIFDTEHLSVVKRILDNAQTIYMWNMTVDVFMMAKVGIEVNKAKILDAMLMEHLVDERLPHSLGEYALREFHDNYKDEFWGLYKSYQEAPKEVAYEYEMRDGCYTYIAGRTYHKRLEARMALVHHVSRLQWSLFETETKGIAVDVDLMRRTKAIMSAQIAEFLPKLRSEFDDYCKIWELNKWQEEIAKRKTDRGRAGVARPEFNFSSDSQLKTLLFGEHLLHLPSEQKTKKGSPSTSTESLRQIAALYPKIQPIVDYKEVKAVYATFVEGMLERVENDSRIYPGFFINGTATGRISHNNPNMGNLPTDGVIRNFFIPDIGHSIVGADYSQLEVVVEANLTEDPQLLKIILEGASKHDITAQGLSISRDQAKTLNFALQYGAGVQKIRKLLSVSGGDAEDIFDRYWKLYSGIKDYKDKVAKILKEQGQVTNLFGRTRHFDKPRTIYEAAANERKAYSHMVQGVGADITNRATYLISDHMRSNNLGRMLFSVHDEIVCEAKDMYTEKVKYDIVSIMKGVSKYVNFKYALDAKSYGPMQCWGKG